MHELIAINKRKSSLRKRSIWLTSLVCSCGFLSYSQESLNRHLADAWAKETSEAILKALIKYS